jgi:hypothetical protein
MRLALITKKAVHVFDGREHVAQFDIQHRPTAAEIEQARTVSLHQPRVVYPVFGRDPDRSVYRSMTFTLPELRGTNG